MTRIRRGPAQELRATIDRLPLEIRRAVLAGIKTRRIIAGAHVDGLGGVCPMTAADIRWQRLDRASIERAQEAARAWDQYADATSVWHPATKHQLVALQAMLEASLMEHPAQEDVSTHRTPRSDTRRSDTGERDRTIELQEREGWSWLRPFRSYDEYQDALEALPHTGAREAELVTSAS